MQWSVGYLIWCIVLHAFHDLSSRFCGKTVYFKLLILHKHNGCKEMPEKRSLYNNVHFIKRLCFWEYILHFLEEVVAVRRNKAMFLKPLQNSTGEFFVILASQLLYLLRLQCRIEICEVKAIARVELEWICRQVDRSSQRLFSLWAAFSNTKENGILRTWLQ